MIDSCCQMNENSDIGEASDSEALKHPMADFAALVIVG